MVRRYRSELTIQIQVQGMSAYVLQKALETGLYDSTLDEAASRIFDYACEKLIERFPFLYSFEEAIRFRCIPHRIEERKK